MLRTRIDRSKESRLRALFLGAHPDDIEIGCGGTAIKLFQQFERLSVYWVVFSGDEVRHHEARQSATSFLKGAYEQNIVLLQFADSLFPSVGAEIKAYFTKLRREFQPDIIFTHCRNDLHQDHRTISELTWNTFRDHLIMEYEIVKYDGDLGCPNVYVHVDNDVCSQKVGYIMANFESQRDKHWFTEDALLSILRIRGIESNSPTKYAEAFYCRKMVL